MKQTITWNKTKGDSISGNGIQIHYTYTSFDDTEIEKLKQWCEEHIKSGIILDNVSFDGE